MEEERVEAIMEEYAGREVSLRFILRVYVSFIIRLALTS